MTLNRPQPGDAPLSGWQDEQANIIAETIRVLLTERTLFVVKPQHPTMGEVALEHYGFGKACDAVALQGDDLAALLSDIGARCAAEINKPRKARSL